MKTAAYFGEFDSNNLGDVAVYTVLGDCYSSGNRITPIPLGKEFVDTSLQRKLDQCSSIMIGGGTQLTPLNADYMRAMFRRDLKVWSFGTGVGSCGFCEEPDPDLSGIARLLKQIDPLTVRGPLSRNLLSRYGIHARVIGDPALGYAKDHVHSSWGRKIVVNLTSPVDSEEILRFGNFLSAAAEALTVFRKKGWLIQFLAMGPGDYEYIDDFRTGFGFSDAEVGEIYTSTRAFFDYVRGAALILSMRLHGAVLASCAGLPFLLCNYRAKCRDFTASLGLDGLLLSPNVSTKTMVGTMNLLLEKRSKISASIRSKALFFRDLQASLLENQLRQ
ncbi:MAG: polysaccharide pyruvyl transferase family protein [Desulfobacteraceae bacterium]|nr:MAG: polysaccharide pyruvyl transferase family protein [Desulfobacteraceae bacterium]